MSPSSHKYPFPHVMLALVAGLGACGGTQTPQPPPGLPPIEAEWAHLLLQVPDNARALLLASFDGAPGATLESVLDGLDLLAPLSHAIRDVLGVAEGPVDYASWGLRSNGALALFLQGERWVLLVDLADDEPLRQRLEAVGPRHPAWQVAWREVDGEDVLSIADATDGLDPSARTHILVTNEQAVLVHDRSLVPDADAADALLLDVRFGRFAQNAMYNRRFGQAVAEFGGQTWILWFADTPGLLQALPPRQAGVGWAPHAGRVPAPRERCAEVERAIGEAVPYILGMGEHGQTSADPNGSVEERWTTRAYIDALHQRTAAVLLPAPPLDWHALSNGTFLAGFASLDPRVLAEALGPLADAAGCPSLASEAALLGGLGQAAAHDLEFGQELGSLFALGVFDVRNTGGVPFADAFCLLGSVRPTGLSEALRQLLEHELGLVGTSEVVGGFSAVHYRFALLYLVGIYDGPAGVGVSLGRVEEGWLEQALATPPEPDPAFFHLVIDGPRLAAAYRVLADSGALGNDGEPAPAADRVPIPGVLDELARTLRLEIVGALSDGVVTVQVARERLP